MDDIKSFFQESDKGFTIYVVEQKFANGRGLDYFNSYRGKSNYIDTDLLAKQRITKILSWIQNNIPIIGDMIRIGFSGLTPAGIKEIIVALNKLFGSQEHQAAGPEVIDPIIIQEGKVIKKYINQLINLHKNSFLAPTIIILLKDNNFERAKDLLSECPDGTNVKFIRNNGQCEMDKIVNVGAEDVNAFIDSFAEQCFSTCSKTEHGILLNKEWANDSLVKLYAPRLLRYRSNLLCDEKNEIRNYLDECILQLENQECATEHDRILRSNFICIAKLYRVFCNDQGGEDILDAQKIAQELNNELLLAYVYKYAYFIGNTSISEQVDMLQQANKIFMDNSMCDNAIYCKNNMLVRQFDSENIYPHQFSDMLGEAISDVPGLVGMSHLYNNTGMAYMMSAKPERAMELFDKGLEYADSTKRQVQYFAILCNKLIAQSYYEEQIEFADIKRVFTQIYDGMVRNNQLPFISARYIMNLLVVATRKNKDWAKELLQEHDIIKLFNSGLDNNTMGSGQLLKQLDYIDQKLPESNIKGQCYIPSKVAELTGRRKDFIEETGLNPFYFFTWL